MHITQVADRKSLARKENKADSWNVPEISCVTTELISFSVTAMITIHLQIPPIQILFKSLSVPEPVINYKQCASHTTKPLCITIKSVKIFSSDKYRSKTH